MQLGRVLSDYRWANRIGLRELAVTIGTSTQTLHRIEHGKDCDSRTLIKILTWLLTEGEYRRQPEEPQDETL